MVKIDDDTQKALLLFNRRSEAVEAAKAAERNLVKAAKAKLKKEKLRGYILSGSLLRMERVDDRMVVKISLNVFSNPDYNIHSTLLHLL